MAGAKNPPANAIASSPTNLLILFLPAILPQLRSQVAELPDRKFLFPMKTGYTEFVNAPLRYGSTKVSVTGEIESIGFRPSEKSIAKFKDFLGPVCALSEDQPLREERVA